MSRTLSVFTELYCAVELHVDSYIWGGNCGEIDVGRMSRNCCGEIYTETRYRNVDKKCPRLLIILFTSTVLMTCKIDLCTEFQIFLFIVICT